MKTRMAASSYPLFCVLAALALAACSFTPPSNQVPAPVMNPPPGVYNGGEIKITIKCDDPDAAIFYTTNGADPSASSMVYMNDIRIRGDATIKAIACMPGKPDSEIAGGIYSAGWMTLPNPDSPPTPFVGLPGGIALAPNGMIYLTDSAGWVYRMDSISGKNLVSFDTGYTVAGISVDPAGIAYFTNFGAGISHIVRIDDITAAVRTAFGTRGTIPPALPMDYGTFCDPYGVAVSSGKFFVADSLNNRIVCFDEMNFWTGWTSYGVWGHDQDQFSGPGGIAVGPDGKIYVADTGNNRIVRIDSLSGVINWIALGDPYSAITDGFGHFNQPAGIAVDTKNRIYVADTLNGRIVRIEDMAGKGWKELKGDITSPIGIAVDGDFVYVTDAGRVVRCYWP